MTTRHPKQTATLCCRITTPDDGAARIIWQRLWEQNRNRDFFASPAFFDACRDGMATGNARIVLCTRDGLPVGVLPLLRARIHGIRGWAVPGWTHNHTDHMPMIAPDATVARALVAAARAMGPLALAEMSSSIRIPYAVVADTSVAPYRNLTPATDPLDVMPRSQRRTLLRQRRRLSNRLTFRLHDGDDLDIARAIERRSDRALRAMRFFDVPTNERFLAALRRHCTSALRVGVLSLDGTPIAAVTGFVTGSTFATYHMAFDTTAAPIGPGKLLFQYLLAHLQSTGTTHVDFLRGDSGFKRQFTTTARRQRTLLVSRSLVLRTWWLCTVAVVTLRRVIARGVRHVLTRFARAQSAATVIFSTFDSVGHPVYNGGGAIAIHEIARRLVAVHGYAVTVIAGRYPGSGATVVRDGVRYEYVGCTWCGPRIAQALFPLRVLLAARRRAIVWFDSFTPPLSVSLLPLLARARVIGVAHMLAGRAMRRTYFGLPFDVVERHGLRLYRHVIATTPHMAHRLRALCRPSATVHTIPVGFNAAVFAPDAASRRTRQPYIAFLGRIDIHQKGLDLLIAAFAMLPATTRPHLRIAGTGTVSALRHLRRHIAHHGLGDSVTVCGHIATDIDRAAFLRDAVLTAVPSRFETFGMTALESLAVSTPVITLPIAGFGWIPADCRITAARKTAQALANALQRGMMESETLRRACHHARPELVAAYEWGSVTAAYADLVRHTRTL